MSNQKPLGLSICLLLPQKCWLFCLHFNEFLCFCLIRKRWYGRLLWCCVGKSVKKQTDPTGKEILSTTWRLLWSQAQRMLQQFQLSAFKGAMELYGLISIKYNFPIVLLILKKYNFLWKKAKFQHFLPFLFKKKFSICFPWSWLA